jgi:hypothetical protein
LTPSIMRLRIMMHDINHWISNLPMLCMNAVSPLKQPPTQNQTLTAHVGLSEGQQLLVKQSSCFFSWFQEAIHTQWGCQEPTLSIYPGTPLHEPDRFNHRSVQCQQ